MKDKFQFVNGHVTLSNDILEVDKSFRIKEDNMLFYGVASISIVATFVDKVINFNSIVGLWGYLKLGLYGMAILFILYSVYNLIFKKHWSNKIEINEISIVDVDNDEENKFVTEITISTNTKREKVIKFRKLENQVEPFLQSLKRRNARIEVKYH